MRGFRALAWLACVGACAAKQDAVNAKKTAREVAAEMIESKLATQTTRPVFEQGRRSLQGCVNDDSTTDSFGDTCSGWYDSNPDFCGNDDDEDFTASVQCCACGGGLYGGSFAPTLTPKPTISPKPTFAPTPRPTRSPVALADGIFIANDITIREAVSLWLSDRAAAIRTYGHISMWGTGNVTDVGMLFRGASSFNEDITAWDTSGVTTMEDMFRDASAFNQPLNDWRVDKVTRMYDMFAGASSFNQPLSDWRIDSVTRFDFMFNGASAFDQVLGWCVGDEVQISSAFRDTKCEALSCGVVQGVCPDPEATAREYCKLSDPELCPGSRVSFVEALSNPFANIQNRYSVPLIADLDGDKTDLLVGQEDGTIALYRRTESEFQHVVGDEDPFKGVTVGGHAAPALVDLDGDGLLDLIVGAQGGGLAFYANTGTTTAPVFTKVSDAVTQCGDDLKPVDTGECPVTSETFSPCNIAACGDLCDGGGECGTSDSLDNCDGFFDIYRKLCDARVGPFSDIGLTATYTAPAFADLDGDGLEDLVIGKATSGALTYYKNVGSPTVADFLLISDGPFANVVVGRFSKPTFYDIDNDGDQDLIVGDSVGDVLLFLNVGSRYAPSFLVVEGTFAGIIPIYAAPTFGMLNQVPSLVVGSAPGHLLVYGETPTQVEFVTTKNSPLSGIDVGLYGKPTLVDLDDDGDLDLVVGEGYGRLNYWRNVGTSSQPSFEKVDVGSPFDGIDVGGYSTPAFVDLDNDGDLDLVVGESDGTLHYYRNVGTKTQPSLVEVRSCLDDLTTKDLYDDDCRYYSSDDCEGERDTDDFKASEQCCVCGGGRLTGEVSPFDGIEVNGVYGYSSPTFLDLDNDGDLDLVFGEFSGTLHYYRNVGTPSQPKFEKVGGCVDDSMTTDSSGDDCSAYDRNPFGCGRFDDEDFTASEQCCACGGGSIKEESPFDGVKVGFRSAPTFVDLDGDGDPDLVVGASDGQLEYYRNVGTPSQPSFEKLEGESPFDGIDVGDFSTPTFADLDDDDDLDLIVGGADGRLSYFQSGSSCIRTSDDGACSGNGVCGSTGTCECTPKYRGAQCDECRGGYYGMTCENCPDNTWSLGGVGLFIEDCRLCEEGYYKDGNNCTKCASTWLCSEKWTRADPNYNVTMENFECKAKFYREGDECKDCEDTMICEDTATGITLENVICRTGFYRDNGCKKCKEGMVCDEPGVTVENVRLEKQYWRTSSKSDKIEACPLVESCRSTNDTNIPDAGEAICEKGHEGPLCAICKRHYYRLGSECLKCRKGTYIFTIIGFVLGLIVFVAFLVLAMNYSNVVGAAVKEAQSSTKDDPALGRQASRYAFSNSRGTSSFALGADIIGSAIGNEASGELEREMDDKTNAWWSKVKNRMSKASATKALGGKLMAFVNAARQDAPRRNITTFVKQISGMYSIFVTIPWVLDIKFPNLYEKVLDAISLMNINMSFSFECVVSRKVTFQDQLLAVTIGPVLAILFVLALGKFWLWYKKNEHKLKEERKRTTILVIAQLVLLILFLSYTSTSTTIFRAFRPCDRLDEKYHGSNEYMHDDYNVSCKSKRYIFILIYAGLMVLIYPIGIPLASFIAMWRHREKLNPPKQDKTFANSDTEFRRKRITEKNNLRDKKILPTGDALFSFAQLFQFMYDNYEPEYWWFECFDYVRRLALTGLMVVILPGSALQGFIGVLIALAGLMSYTIARPFVEDASDNLAMATQLSTFFVFLSALMVQVDVVYHRSGFAALLTVVTFVPPFISLCSSIHTFRNVMIAPVDDSSKATPSTKDATDSESSPTSPLSPGAPPQEDEEQPAAIDTD